MPSVITDTQLMEHVLKLGDEHPPIRMDSADFTVKNPALMREKFGGVLDYLARVELEVDRNVLELLTILPHASEVDRVFYQDVWYDQEMAHGYILDRLKDEMGLAPAEPYLEVKMGLKALGALAHFEPIHDVVRCIYYLTGASTERQAVMAYNSFSKQLLEMGEKAVARTIINPIKRQEPGHFAFYRMSAEKLVQDGLRPWQLYLARLLRKTSYALVGTNRSNDYKAQMGEVITKLGFDEQLEQYAKEIGRLEARLLWASEQGMDFPPYVLAALRESVDLYRDRGTFETA